MRKSIDVYIDRINAAKSFPILYKIGNDFYQDYVIPVYDSGQIVMILRDKRGKEVLKLLEEKLEEVIKEVITLN